MKCTPNTQKGTGWWEEKDPKCCYLLASFVLWPLASDLLHSAHCLFDPLLSKHAGLIPMLPPSVATGLYLQKYYSRSFDKSSRAMKIDYRAILRLICFFNTELEIQTSCYRHSTSTPPHAPLPSLLSVSIFPVISIIMEQDSQHRHGASCHCCLVVQWALDMCTCWRNI